MSEKIWMATGLIFEFIFVGAGLFLFWHFAEAPISLMGIAFGSVFGMVGMRLIRRLFKKNMNNSAPAETPR